MIEAEGLVKHYGRVEALRGVTFRVEPGEIVGYLGPNGAGKSTTVKMLTGLQPPTSGTARIAGYDVVQHPVEAKARIGLVPESGALYEALTPVEYLRFAADLHELDPSMRNRRIPELLEFLELESSVWHARMVGFSKGMKQRVVIAAAVLHDPAVLVFDEPLNGLDVHATVRVKELIADAARRERAVFYCSHLMDVVERVCSRIIIVSDGRIRLDGSVREILDASPGQTLEQVFQSSTGREAEHAPRPLEPS